MTRNPKQTSDKVAKIASRILKSLAEGPLYENYDDIVGRRFVRTGYTAEHVRTLAASLVSQSDGPEAPTVKKRRKK